MGMYFKQQQTNSRLHDKLTTQLDKHLAAQKVHPKTAELAAEKPVVSFRWALFIVLTSGGAMAILLALLQRQNPGAVDNPFRARTLAFLGLASILLGCLSLIVRRNHKPQV